jgi:hypothetical protein
VQAGPAARTLADAPQLVLEGVRRDLRDRLSQSRGAQGFELPGATWIARALAR